MNEELQAIDALIRDLENHLIELYEKRCAIEKSIINQYRDRIGKIRIKDGYVEWYEKQHRDYPYTLVDGAIVALNTIYSSNTLDVRCGGAGAGIPIKFLEIENMQALEELMGELGYE